LNRLNLELQEDAAEIRLETEIYARLSAATSGSTATEQAQSSKKRPSNTLFDLGFTKSKIITTSTGAQKVITFTTAAAAEGTTITDVGEAGKGASKVLSCRYSVNGCAKLVKNQGNKKLHELTCGFQKVKLRQASIFSSRATLSCMSFVLAPRIAVTDYDKEQEEAERQAQLNALAQTQREQLKRRKDGNVDARVANRGSHERRRYSAIFKAKVVREVVAHRGPAGTNAARIVADSYQPKLQLSDTMLARYAHRFV